MKKQYEEVITFLEELGLEKLSKEEKKSIYERIAETGDLKIVKQDLEILYAINRVLITEYEEISISNMNKINEKIDMNLLVKLMVVYHKIKTKNTSGLKALHEFKFTCLKILKENKLLNEEMQNISSSYFSALQDQKSALYLSMNSKDKADTLLANCYKRAKISISKCQATNLEDLIYCLKRNFRLSDDDLVEISKQCATFFVLSNSDKLINLEKTLNNFKQFIENELISTNKANLALKLLNKDFKDVLKKTASIATIDPKALNDTIKFLKGVPIKQISTFGNKGLPNLKGNFTPAQLAKIYSKSMTSLSTNVGKIHDVCYGVYTAYNTCYGETMDISNIMNGRNFPSLTVLRKDDYDENGKINIIFSLLSPFFAKEEMLNLLENDMGFLKASVNEVEQGIQEAILSSKNNDELKSNLLKKIRKNFSDESGHFVNANRDESIVVDKKKKVNINNLSEEEIVKLLSKLSTNASDIEKWRSNWDKEDKEYRMIALQINLEDILSQSKDLEKMLDFDDLDESSFSSELEAVIDLFNELSSEKKNIVSRNKLNKEAKILVEKIDEQLENVKNIINGKITYLTSTYFQLIESLREDLDNKISIKEDYETKLGQIKDLEKEIKEKGVADEITKKMEDEIEEIDSIVAMMKKEHKRMVSLSHECNKGIVKFHDLLLEKERKRVITNDSELSNSNHYTPAYNFAHFIYVLSREGLFNNEGQYDFSKIREKDITIDEIFKRLDSQEEAMARSIYEKYKLLRTIAENSLKKGLDKLSKYVPESTNGLGEYMNYVKALQSVGMSFKREVSWAKKIVEEKKSLEDSISKIDLVGLEKSLVSILDRIEEAENKKSYWTSKRL